MTSETAVLYQIYDLLATMQNDALGTQNGIFNVCGLLLAGLLFMAATAAWVGRKR